MHRIVVVLLVMVASTGPAAAADLSYCQQAKQALDNGGNPAAIQLYGLCIDRGGLGTVALADAYYHRGEAQRRMGKLSDALGDFSAALRARFDMTEAYIARAITFAQAGQHGMAIVDYDRAIIAQPKTPSLYYNRALSRIASTDYDRALRDLDKVLELDPNFLGAVHYNRGVVFARLRLYEQAAKAFELSIDRRWQLAIAYLERGLTLIKGGHNRQAYADFSNALVLKPNFGDAFAWRALARERLGDRAGAVGDYRKAVDFGTTQDWVRKRLNS